MRKLALLLAAGTLWLFLAAIPAFADGGPHVASINNGTTSLTADSCAGCHRIHTATGPYIINQTDEKTMCVSCHGAASTGATTDVITGVQYRALTDGTRPPVGSTTKLGALRGGGFDQARIGDPFRVLVQTNATLSSSRVGKIQVEATAQDVTSAHMPTFGGLSQPGKAWGNGANGSGAGPTATVSCGSCHNPHGNGQYRILNPIPSAASGAIDATWGGGRLVALTGAQSFGTTAGDNPVLYTTTAAHNLGVDNLIKVADSTAGTLNVSGYVASVPSGTTFTLKSSLAGSALKLDATAGTGGTVTVKGIDISTYTPSSGQFQTKVSHGLLIGDNVTISGSTEPTANATGIVTSVSNDYRFILDFTGGSSGTGGMVIRNGGVRVTDAPNPTNATRNYTVIQDAPTVAVVSYSGTDGTFQYTTAAAHGFVVGDQVAVGGMKVGGSTSGVSSNTTQTVSAVGSGTTFKLTGVTYDQNAVGGTAVGVNEVLLASDVTTGGYGPLAGDYFHYRVPWIGDASMFDAPNGIPKGTSAFQFTGGFSEQMTMWCSSCHTRYYARTIVGAPSNSGAAYSNPRPGDDIFKYQHRTNANSSNRACTTCHVSHGSNAQMTGPYSDGFTYPGGTAASAGNSRLLKIDNRGTCQQCHDPSGTAVAGDQFPYTGTFAVSDLTSFDAATDEFTTADPITLTNGDQVAIANTGSTDAFGRFYVVNVNTGTDTFQVSLTGGGAAVDFASNGTGGTVGIVPQTP